MQRRLTVTGGWDDADKLLNLQVVVKYNTIKRAVITNSRRKDPILHIKEVCELIQKYKI